MYVKFWGTRGSIPTPISSVVLQEKIRWALENAAGLDLSDPAVLNRYMERLPFTVGRQAVAGESDATVDLKLDDFRPFRLSCAHFKLVQEGDGLLVQDLGSILGTMVNGRAIGQFFGTDTAPLVAGENEIVAGGADSHFRFRVMVESA